MSETLQAMGNLMLVKGDLVSAKIYLEQSMKLSGDAKTKERALTIRSLSNVYAGLKEDDKHRECHEKLLALSQAAPSIAKALNDTPEYLPRSSVESHTPDNPVTNNPLATAASRGNKSSPIGSSDVASREPQHDSREDESTHMQDLSSKEEWNELSGDKHQFF
jgi:hypothetical protein